MLPIDQRRSGIFSAVNAFLYEVRQWVRAEIVDDDPWDQGTLLPSSDNNLVDPKVNPVENASSNPEQLDSYN